MWREGKKRHRVGGRDRPDIIMLKSEKRRRCSTCGGSADLRACEAGPGADDG